MMSSTSDTVQPLYRPISTPRIARPPSRSLVLGRAFASFSDPIQASSWIAITQTLRCVLFSAAPVHPLIMSAAAHAALEEFWSDDFRPLELAGMEILRALRYDEGTPSADLYRCIASSEDGSHLYVPESDRAPVASSLVHERFIPIPPLLSQAQLSAKISLRMGCISEAGMAWMTVDDKLYLWPLQSALEDASPDLSEFVVPSGQCINSIGLVKPKKGVFKSIVKWCLVVATPDECILCALTQTNTGFGIVPTRYVVSTDRVPVLSICGTPEGRIFLGGCDGSLYELAYESLVRDAPPKSVDEQWKDFYDGTSARPKLVQPSLTGEIYRRSKRTIAALVTDGTQPRKCRKLNHSSTPMSSLMTSVVPESIISVSTSISNYTFGSFSSTETGPIIQVTFDKERKFLYTLSENGFLSVFDLRGKKVALRSSMNTVKAVISYLSAVSKGHGSPAFSSNAKIEFPGGLASAQAGVGGMDGARSILKQAESTQGGGRFAIQQHTPRTRINILTPISIHIIPRQESAKLTLMVISSGGLRYYISSLNPATFSSPVNTAPHSSFTVCYVRAPPPLDSKGMPEVNPTGDSTKGLAPKLGTAERTVDAGYHSRGLSILALTLKSGGDLPKNCNRNVIAAFLANSVRRNDEEEIRKVVSKHHINLVNESLCLPISSFSADFRGLPGGRVMDISLLPSQTEKPMMKLLLNSQTPTDSELAVGLVPAFVPAIKMPSKPSLKGVQYGTNGSLEGSGSGIVVRADGSAASTSAIALTVLSNFLLSRPLKYGLSYQSSNRRKTEGDETLYHISSRSGTGGFASSTAGTVDGSTSSVAVARSSNHSHRSARLSPWLLNPRGVPLSQFAIQHLEGARGLVAMNSGGLHVLKTVTVMARLGKALMLAGANIDTDEHINRFFTSYGYEEGCAMCITLACGCGPANGIGADCDDLKSRARSAALNYGFSPKLVFKRDQDDSSLVSSSVSSDSVLPKNYSFQSSSLYGGLTMVMSRLLRPVWCKALCVVTEGDLMKTRGLTRTFPAKVELLLDDATLHEVRQPLEALLFLMRTVFSPAINVVPGKSKNQNKSEMEVEDYSNPEMLITGTMFYQNRVNGDLSQLNGQLSERDCEAIARLIEERNIHCLYRLLSRSIQVLDLYAHLRKAHFMMDLPEVDWGLLHGLTMAQLVLAEDGQERLDGLLSSLVCSSKIAVDVNATPTADADRLARLLSEQCYLLFSPGSRFAYLGFRAATEAIGCPLSSRRRETLAADAVRDLRRASSFWQSAQLVAGKRLNSRENETYDQIASRALQNDSPLAKAASMLFELGCYVAIVDVCLTAAANFKEKEKPKALTNGEEGTHVLGWEKGLYHKRRSKPSTTKPQSPASPSSSTTTIIVGANLTEEEAIKTCHSILFFHLNKLLKSSGHSDHAERMVASCAASSDKIFLASFFGHLLRADEIQVLLRIDSPDLETFLKDPSIDPDLLWQYYIVQGQHGKAGHIMWMRATESGGGIGLDERLDLLTKSLNSYRTALQVSRGNSGGDTSEVSRLVTMVQETLDVALFQKRILRAVDSSSLEDKLEVEQASNLKKTLLPVSDLYNDYAAPLNLFDCCLLILHSCRYNESVTIEVLWRSLICEELVPCCTRDRVAHGVIQKLISGSLVDETVVFLSDDSESAEDLPLVENGDWVERVRSRVISLGKDLYGHGADYTFPLDLLVVELESLRRQVVAVDIGPWPMLALLDSGVPVETVFSSYEAAGQRQEKDSMLGSSTNSQRFHLVESMVEVLEEWIKSIQRKRAGGWGNNLTSLLQARQKLTYLKVNLEAMMGGGVTEEIKRVHQRVVEIEAAMQVGDGKSSW